MLGALVPRVGVLLRRTSIGSVTWFGNKPVGLVVPTLLLALMLFNAGLGVRTEDIASMLKRPKLLLVGLAANAVLPIVFIGIAAFLLRSWADADETQNLLVGLALIGAMPVAGGSTVCAQNADGDVPLFVGLVLGTTLLSPFTIPLALRAVALMTHGDYSDDFGEMAREGSGTFAVVSVVIPCALGVLVRQVVGSARLAHALPWIKLANLANILLLSYSNASGALTEVIAHPDADLLVIVFCVTGAMCAASFAVGDSIARRLRAEAPQVTTMTFGVGMFNSSASSVLAATSLSDHPLVLLPILAYSLLQKIVAGAVDGVLGRRRERQAGTSIGSLATAL